ncbi:MAG TPA: Asp-tRNA(Asn)/Glu-tRNA(Gln) amidotransferase subunit GatB [Verrucomicrobiae bacterium]|nr:Asp-tRNA(Asn)/Glu-tRNA(Gln) amidotransferase subunit GatB [Verrucomicrobiae bacterium]
MEYEAVIGLEVHVQLKTKSKMFCGCATEFGAEPNTHVCPVCLGYPGVLPVMNEEAVRKTILTGLMIGSEIAEFSKWDRKNYFYPDMPKNYQISQYDLPLCLHGTVEIRLDGGQTRKIGITRAHLEEDVAKNIHFETTSGVDFNRAGTPLMEIVSEPDLRSPEEAFAYLTALKEILMSGDVSDCDMEKGQLRCDSNISVRPVGQKEFGEKVEIKNMNTISGVRRALAYEIQRQTAALQKGEKVSQETRRWDDAAGRTFVMRTKEYAHDYRYFPEPDLMPVVVGEELVAEVRRLLPELPETRRQRFVKQYGLPEYDAGVLVADGALATFYERAAHGAQNPKAIANWVMTELLGKLGEAKTTISECPIKPEGLAELVDLIDSNQISGKIGKEVFAEMFTGGKTPSDIVREKGWVQVSDTGALEALVEQAIAGNPKSVADFRAGNQAAINFLKGQVMKLSKGKANPQVAGEILLRKLNN